MLYTPRLYSYWTKKMTESKPVITHVIFDLDGLILDTEVLYTRVTQQILDRYGKTFEWSLKTKMMGRKPIDGATILVKDLQLPMTPEEFHKELYGKLMSMFPDAELMPGAETLIRHLHSHGIPLAICTGSSQQTYKVKISSRVGLFSCFAHAVCSDDDEVKNGKPAPDIYLVTAQQFTSHLKSNENVLVFEDAPNGVESAKSAGMNVVMVPHKRTEPEKCRGADRVITSLEELDLEEWGLPPLPDNSA